MKINKNKSGSLKKFYSNKELSQIIQQWGKEGGNGTMLRKQDEY